MSTMGAVGFVINGKTKVILSRYDSYPKGLGLIVVGFVQKLNFKRFKKIFKNMEPMSENDVRSKNSVWDSFAYSMNLIYCGAIYSYIDGTKIIEEELVCSYYYLVDFDSNEFRIYRNGKSLLVDCYKLDSIPKNWISLSFENEEKNIIIKNNAQNIVDYLINKGKNE